MKYYINTQGQLYVGDLQTGDREATEAEVQEHFSDKRSYAEKRANEYPSVGDMIDAFCKARAGDDSELINLMSLRQAIKEKYPKG